MVPIGLPKYNRGHVYDLHDEQERKLVDYFLLQHVKNNEGVGWKLQTLNGFWCMWTIETGKARYFSYKFNDKTHQVNMWVS